MSLSLLLAGCMTAEEQQKNVLTRLDNLCANRVAQPGTKAYEDCMITGYITMLCSRPPNGDPYFYHNQKRCRDELHTSAQEQIRTRKQEQTLKPKQ
ncbi:hypothetical protein [Microvirga solisilvae]|uniref:hypothetical protein n=1 Tax=Microvirga solisilvae TaxID=2919498 RepID=UPI001FAEE59C|nr:hypothetical protein [Microvirga solisilvae]